MRKYPKYNRDILLLFVAIIACYFTTVASSQKVKECSKHEAKEKDIHRIRLALPDINAVKVGYEQEVELSEGKLHKIKTLSLIPPIFEIPDFFSDEECDLVIDMAKYKGMKDSPVIKDPRVLPNNTTKQVFDEWDINEDGFIDPEEVIYLPGKNDLYLTEEDVTKMFADLAIDKDQDGQMNFEEFQEVKIEGIKKYFDSLREVKSRLHSRSSQQTWLWHDEDELLQYEDLLEDYHDRFSKLTKLPRKIIEDSEPLQVVHYDQHGHYHCHHDSDILNIGLPCCTYGASGCRLCRYLTVAIFLNDVQDGGELAFPVADNITFNWESWTTESLNKCNLAQHCSNSNLVIKPNKGKAILFYNHKLDHKTHWVSAIEPRALVGGCDVTKGEKWMANAWININGDGINQLRSWKTGVNWITGNNMNQQVINALKRVEEERDDENRCIPENTEVLTDNKIEKHETENIYTLGKYTEAFKSKKMEQEEFENRYTLGKNTGTHASNKIEGPPVPEGTKETKHDQHHIRGTYDAIEGINMKEVRKDNTPQTQQENTYYAKQSGTSLPSQTPEDNEPGPIGPTVHLGVTPAPLPLPLETLTPNEPKPPIMDDPPTPPQEGYRVLRSIMLLIDELDHVELEILARNLHSKLKLVCVPLIMNPMGSIRG